LQVFLELARVLGYPVDMVTAGVQLTPQVQLTPRQKGQTAAFRWERLKTLRIHISHIGFNSKRSKSYDHLLKTRNNQNR